MSSNVGTVNVKLDTLKLVVAVVIIISGVIGFYFFAGYPLWMRLVGLLACVGVATAVAWQTEKGRNSMLFIQGAQLEVRKVVWPTRQETLQTTLIVIIVVIIVAIILWLLDMFLGWSVRTLMGQGG